MTDEQTAEPTAAEQTETETAEPEAATSIEFALEGGGSPGEPPLVLKDGGKRLVTTLAFYDPQVAETILNTGLAAVNNLLVLNDVLEEDADAVGASG